MSKTSLTIDQENGCGYQVEGKTVTSVCTCLTFSKAAGISFILYSTEKFTKHIFLRRNESPRHIWAHTGELILFRDFFANHILLPMSSKYRTDKSLPLLPSASSSVKSTLMIRSGSDSLHSNPPRSSFSKALATPLRANEKPATNHCTSIP